MPEMPEPSSPDEDPAITRAVPTFAGDSTEQPPQDPGAPAIQIEGYRILNEISRGGQAIVFCAILERTGRRVAVKVMREGPLATENGRARFSREAQILASLNHPNIVTILDRGRTSDGSEYFTMDYIEGQSLDEGTWKAKRPEDAPTQPLQLFLKICDAVNAAHLRGIVHRDLKPSNIRLDERGEPHVLDFGLARGSFSEDLQKTGEPVTITGQFLGSLPWASPEQAEGIGQKIDMRSDVYSLGVILYQLVTGGSFPYQVAGSMRDVLNNIMTAEPPAPSVILSERESRDVARRIKRTGIHNKLINPALDAIVLKSLAKRRDDRYQSAGDLARDIEAYLAGRPLQASGLPGARQRRKPLAIAGIVACVIIAALMISVFRKKDPSLDNPPAQNSAMTSQAPAAGVSPSGDRQLPALVASSTLKQEYQDLELIMNRFMPILGYLRAHAAARFPVWLDAAERGDAIGQMLVGRCYEFGVGVKRNVEMGNRYLDASAEQKLPMALCLIGLKFRASLPPVRDYEKAIHWYTRAADAGNARAMMDLGIMYHQGLGVPANPKAALEWLHKSAALGAPAAYTFLGDVYRTPGNGVTDLPRAIAMYRRSVEVGAPVGYFAMAQLHATGTGVPQDYAEAMRLLLRADADEVYGAAERIGDFHLEGRGVPKDPALAVKWYTKAVNANAPGAMRKLAALYDRGDGVPKDPEKAVALYTQAAASGDETAKQWLANQPSTQPGK